MKRSTCIIRNILEFICIIFCIRDYFLPVLIETLWNVKTATLFLTNLVAFVLIETLWNVKVVWFNYKEGYLAGINRNIVECKAITAMARPP